MLILSDTHRKRTGRRDVVCGECRLRRIGNVPVEPNQPKQQIPPCFLTINVSKTHGKSLKLSKSQNYVSSCALRFRILRPMSCTEFMFHVKWFGPDGSFTNMAHGFKMIVALKSDQMAFYLRDKSPTWHSKRFLLD